MLDSARKDVQTVTPNGQTVAPLIDGVVIRPAVTQIDDRGTVCEILDTRWDLTDDPILYVYEFTIRPGKVKGWHVHHDHEDRWFLSRGELKAVLYDAREESPTFGMINEIFRSELRRGLMIVPRGVFHAYENIGTTDATVVNLPSSGYDHADPDVYRLPLDTDAIPYSFEPTRGG